MAVWYQINGTGIASLFVSFDGQYVGAGATPIAVLPGVLSPTASTTFSPSAAAVCFTGATTTFLIAAKDTFGNALAVDDQRLYASWRVVAYLVGGTSSYAWPLGPDMRQTTTGQILLRVLPDYPRFQPGTYVLKALYFPAGFANWSYATPTSAAAYSVTGPTITVVCSTLPPAAANSTLLVTPSVLVAGVALNATVAVRDRNNVLACAGAVVTADLVCGTGAATSMVQSAATLGSSCSFSALITPTLSGSCIATGYVNGIGTAPVLLTVQPATASGGNSSLAPVFQSALVAASASVAIAAFDKYGNAATGSGLLLVSAFSNGASSVVYSGTFVASVSYGCQAVGVARVSATMGGIALASGVTVACVSGSIPATTSCAAFAGSVRVRVSQSPLVCSNYASVTPVSGVIAAAAGSAMSVFLHIFNPDGTTLSDASVGAMSGFAFALLAQAAVFACNSTSSGVYICALPVVVGTYAVSTRITGPAACATSLPGADTTFSYSGYGVATAATSVISNLPVQCTVLGREATFALQLNDAAGSPVNISGRDDYIQVDVNHPGGMMLGFLAPSTGRVGLFTVLVIPVVEGPHAVTAMVNNVTVAALQFVFYACLDFSGSTVSGACIRFPCFANMGPLSIVVSLRDSTATVLPVQAFAGRVSTTLSCAYGVVPYSIQQTAAGDIVVLFSPAWVTTCTLAVSVSGYGVVPGTNVMFRVEGAADVDQSVLSIGSACGLTANVSTIVAATLRDGRGAALDALPPQQFSLSVAGLRVPPGVDILGPFPAPSDGSLGLALDPTAAQLVLFVVRVLGSGSVQISLVVDGRAALLPLVLAATFTSTCEDKAPQGAFATTFALAGDPSMASLVKISGGMLPAAALSSFSFTLSVMGPRGAYAVSRVDSSQQVTVSFTAGWPGNHSCTVFVNGDVIAVDTWIVGVGATSAAQSFVEGGNMASEAGTPSSLTLVEVGASGVVQPLGRLCSSVVASFSLGSRVFLVTTAQSSAVRGHAVQFTLALSGVYDVRFTCLDTSKIMFTTQYGVRASLVGGAFRVASVDGAPPSAVGISVVGGHVIPLSVAASDAFGNPTYAAVSRWGIGVARVDGGPVGAYSAGVSSVAWGAVGVNVMLLASAQYLVTVTVDGGAVVNGTIPVSVVNPSVDRIASSVNVTSPAALLAGESATVQVVLRGSFGVIIGPAGAVSCTFMTLGRSLTIVASVVGNYASYVAGFAVTTAGAYVVQCRVASVDLAALGSFTVVAGQVGLGTLASMTSSCNSIGRELLTVTPADAFGNAVDPSAAMVAGRFVVSMACDSWAAAACTPYEVLPSATASGMYVILAHTVATPGSYSRTLVYEGPDGRSTSVAALLVMDASLSAANAVVDGTSSALTACSVGVLVQLRVWCNDTRDNACGRPPGVALQAVVRSSPDGAILTVATLSPTARARWSGVWAYSFAGTFAVSVELGDGVLFSTRVAVVENCGVANCLSCGNSSSVCAGCEPGYRSTSTGLCVWPALLGGACAGNDDCGSATCRGGSCCASDVDGLCAACDVMGRCTQCAQGSMVRGVACLLLRGQPCTSDGACDSGKCDGCVCCAGGAGCASCGGPAGDCTACSGGSYLFDGPNGTVCATKPVACAVVARNGSCVSCAAGFALHPTGACLSAGGGPCVDGTACASGVCSRAFCCGAGAGCSSCGSDGGCSTCAAGGAYVSTAAVPASCVAKPRGCDVVSPLGVCGTCVSTTFVLANGTCLAAGGEPCAGAGECVGTLCSSGICCVAGGNCSSCAGPAGGCTSCAASAMYVNNASVAVCAPKPAGCSAVFNNGTCGSCVRFYSLVRAACVADQCTVDVDCSSGMCSAGTCCVPGGRCASCAGSTGGCTSCFDDAYVNNASPAVCVPRPLGCAVARPSGVCSECGTGFVLNGTVCLAGGGQSCAAGWECASGNCYDGVCCVAGGACAACGAPAGACTQCLPTAYLTSSVPTSCAVLPARCTAATSSGRCIACAAGIGVLNGTCPATGGQPCTNRTGCTSGVCYAGTCCAQGGNCRSCSAPLGSCDSCFSGAYVNSSVPALCAPVPDGCAGILRDGTCTSCLTSNYLLVSPVCLLVGGQACATGGVCASGTCSNGVCCVVGGGCGACAGPDGGCTACALSLSYVWSVSPAVCLPKPAGCDVVYRNGTCGSCVHLYRLLGTACVGMQCAYDEDCPGFFCDAGVCCVPDGGCASCAGSNGSCTTCVDGGAYVNNAVPAVCVPRPRGCAVALPSGSCTVCAPGSTLTGGGGMCLGDGGTQCSADGDCLSARCGGSVCCVVGGACARCSGSAGACTSCAAAWHVSFDAPAVCAANAAGCGAADAGGSCTACEAGFALNVTSSGFGVCLLVGGLSCAADSDCASGRCYGGVCCVVGGRCAACAGVAGGCTACAAGAYVTSSTPATCALVPAGCASVRPDGSCEACVGGFRVVGRACLRVDGRACAAGDACASGQCAGGVCCATGGQCVECAVPDGACTSCPPLWYIDNSTVPVCARMPRGCSSVARDGTCLSCVAGYAVSAAACAGEGGTACTVGGECASAVCSGGVCCVRGGACAACAGPLGACVACGALSFVTNSTPAVCARSPAGCAAVTPSGACTTCVPPYALQGARCLLAAGAPCVASGACASGLCAGGVCCASGNCVACGAPDGGCTACAPAAFVTSTSPASCAVRPRGCDGVRPDGVCVSCVNQHVLVAGGCLLADGQACGAAAECASAQCGGGACCAATGLCATCAPPLGACITCAAADMYLNGAAVAVCVPRPLGCAGVAPNGTCTSCVAGFLLAGATCLAHGGQPCSADRACASGRCSGGVCCIVGGACASCGGATGACTGCAPAAYVNNAVPAVCVAKPVGCAVVAPSGDCGACAAGYSLAGFECRVAGGGACGGPGDCASGVCAGGVCCVVDGKCGACAGAAGGCTDCADGAYVTADVPAVCAPSPTGCLAVQPSGACVVCLAEYVLVAGACLRADGRACSANADCGSKQCVGAVCCASGGQCVACAAPAGACTACAVSRYVDGAAVPACKAKPPGCDAVDAEGVCTSCLAGFAAAAGACVGTGGQACTSGAECASGLCLRGLCCATGGNCATCGGWRGGCDSCGAALYVTATDPPACAPAPRGCVAVARSGACTACAASYALSPSGACLLVDGQPCAAPADCRSGLCAGAPLVCGGSDGAPCGADGDCGGASACRGGRCCAAGAGGAGAECVACSASGACAGCSGGFRLASPPASGCVAGAAAGTTCDADAECANGRCLGACCAAGAAAACALCGSAGSCVTCRAGFALTGGVCAALPLALAGAVCAGRADCASGMCLGGVCCAPGIDPSCVACGARDGLCSACAGGEGYDPVLRTCYDVLGEGAGVGTRCTRDAGCAAGACRGERCCAPGAVVMAGGERCLECSVSGECVTVGPPTPSPRPSASPQATASPAPVPAPGDDSGTIIIAVVAVVVAGFAVFVVAARARRAGACGGRGKRSIYSTSRLSSASRVVHTNPMGASAHSTG